MISIILTLCLSPHAVCSCLLTENIHLSDTFSNVENDIGTYDNCMKFTVGSTDVTLDQCSGSFQLVLGSAVITSAKTLLDGMHMRPAPSAESCKFLWCCLDTARHAIDHLEVLGP